MSGVALLLAFVARRVASGCGGTVSRLRREELLRQHRERGLGRARFGVVVVAEASAEGVFAVVEAVALRLEGRRMEVGQAARLGGPDGRDGDSLAAAWREGRC